MRFVKVYSRDAERIRRELVDFGYYDPKYKAKSDGEFVYFPVKGDVTYDTVELEATPVSKPKSLEEALSRLFPSEELSGVIRSFDIVGDIAVINIPDNLLDLKGKIADAIMAVHKNVHVVCRKVGARQGTFRLAPLEVIGGDDRCITVYKEHDVRMKVDLLKSYFSPRLSNERRRICDLVEDGETIAAFFAGVGPFPLVIARKKNVDIFAVELNPHAYRLMVENIGMNKLVGKITPILGDVREVAKNISKVDRVLMPLPKGAEDFLPSAVEVAKPGAIVHFYQFAPENDLYSDAESRIKSAAREMGREIEIVNEKVVRPYKPRYYQIVIDFRII